MRIAVFGCGSIGRRHIGCLRQLGQSDLVVYDPNREAAELLFHECGLTNCASEDDVWRAEPSVAIITTPAPFHVRLARVAISRGCHVFVEKPLSDSMVEVDELVRDAQKTSVVSMVGCNMRFHPGPAMIHHMIHAGAIGTPLAARLECRSYLPDWRPSQDYRQSISARVDLGGGVLLECIHEIDLALWLFGPGTLVGAALQPAASIGLAVDGLAELLVRHSNGVLSSIHLNFVQRDYRRGCQVAGSQGTLAWDFADPWLELRSGGQQTDRIPLDHSWQLNDMYRDELAEFLACVRSGSQSPCTLADGRRALEIALGAAQMSLDAVTP